MKGMVMNTFRAKSAISAAAFTAISAMGALLSHSIAQPAHADQPVAPGGRAVAEDKSIRPFHVNVSEEELTDLRHRILATRWQDKETVTDQSQGVPLATIKELARYWAGDYDWRKAE